MIRIEPRAQTPRAFALGIPVLSAIVALALAAIPLIFAGANPIVAYGEMFKGVFGSLFAMQRSDPTTGEETLVVQARITGDDQSRLFAGLAGFARIETGQTIRIAALTRYAREYLRMKLWTWFDFQL